MPNARLTVFVVLVTLALRLPANGQDLPILILQVLYVDDVFAHEPIGLVTGDRIELDCNTGDVRLVPEGRGRGEPFDLPARRFEVQRVTRSERGVPLRIVLQSRGGQGRTSIDVNADEVRDRYRVYVTHEEAGLVRGAAALLGRRRAFSPGVPADPNGGAVLGGSFLFLSNRPGGARDGNWDVYLADEACRVRQITDEPGLSIRWIDKDPGHERFVVAASSRGDLRVGPSGGDGPGGEDFIAIYGMDGRQRRILVDCRERGPLNPAGFEGVWHPSFSPDGRRVVFSGTRPRESANLYTIELDGTPALRCLIADPHRTHNDPRYGPGGEIVYVRHDRAGLGQILAPDLIDVWVMDPADPRGATRMTAEAAIAGDPRVETDPAISPDGRRIAAIRAGGRVSVGMFQSLSSSNVVFAANGRGGDFHEMQGSHYPQRVHGVPMWEDDEWILSYRWSEPDRGWRIVRFRAAETDGPIQELDLGSPVGARDLLPVPVRGSLRHRSGSSRE